MRHSWARIGGLQESFERLSKKVQKGLENKAREHNATARPDRRTTKYRLAAVFWRGKGAYKSAPREPTARGIKSPEQWAYARVNSFLRALKNDRFSSGRHDTDLLPVTHPEAT